MSSVSPDVVKELAPTGRLRVALNLGNIVLAQRGADGKPKGEIGRAHV